MMLHTLLLAALSSTGLAAGCTREFLQASADSLLAAQAAGDPSLLKPAPAEAFAAYNENQKTAAFKTGILKTAVKIDHSRHSLDTTQCATYTEIISASGPKPYVIGVQLWFTDGAVSKIDSIVTSTGDWLFNVTGTLSWARKEAWDVIAAEKRDTRAVIQAAADAYLDIFSDKKVVVPWGKPCARLEGGAYTGNGGPNDRCDVGIPDGVKLTNRRYVIDETVGAVDVMLTFASLADSHEFRVEGGKLRFVHTMTPMGGSRGPTVGGKGPGRRRRTTVPM
ncbi:hypothetical protein B0H67DRAFT_582653 [Lasiosphaeris hirsuta]|uniref:DUF8021 domain-containing protein n=1 Tax=Lasiosphaeris hirsuta TaxID=260670 RepID=A0AA40DTZ2_9PEZI|nr:hypothetical protein B0H67DRAFT_582653 [Lasiosphaeris hirsuta]